MNGRWTIIGGGATSNSWLKAPTAWVPAWAEVPVVPCDDAAIERVMAVLDDGRVCPGDESNITPVELRELAEAALRAAGATP